MLPNWSWQSWSCVRKDNKVNVPKPKPRIKETAAAATKNNFDLLESWFNLAIVRDEGKPRSFDAFVDGSTWISVTSKEFCSTWAANTNASSISNDVIKAGIKQPPCRANCSTKLKLNSVMVSGLNSTATPVNNLSNMISVEWKKMVSKIVTVQVCRKKIFTHYQCRCYNGCRRLEYESSKKRHHGQHH